MPALIATRSSRCKVLTGRSSAATRRPHSDAALDCNSTVQVRDRRRAADRAIHKSTSTRFLRSALANQLLCTSEPYPYLPNMVISGSAWPLCHREEKLLRMMQATMAPSQERRRSKAARSATSENPDVAAPFAE